MGTGILYVVSTPIGNLEDMTFRGVRVLKEVDVVAAEDTRRTAKLANHYGLSLRLLSYHAHNKHRRGKQLVEMLRDGKNVALVSDAGTPGISDPGYAIIRAALDEGFEVVPVPGPTALISALTASGLPAGSFTFVGFLSSRRGRRRKQLQEFAGVRRTLVFYEGPHRVVAALEDVLAVMGDRQAAVAREMTKHFEEVVRGRVSDLVDHFREKAPRGEFTVIVEGAPRRRKGDGDNAGPEAL